MYYYIMERIGKARYVVNWHNGIKMHSDGSPFIDIAIFKNKKLMNKFVLSLKGLGYTERV